MSRRRRAEKRQVLPDPKFGDLTVTKFMNYVMYEGKKAVAENIMYGAFEILEAKRKDQGPLETFHAALDNVAPSIEVRSRRVGGATYQVPIEVREDKGIGIAMRWIRNAAQSRGGKSMKSLQDLKAGRTQPMRQAMVDLAKKHRITSRKADD